MLLENFYKIIHSKEREDGKREIEIELNPGHALYQGCLLYTSRCV